jgi:nitrogen permease regulator 2-like protein
VQYESVVKKLAEYLVMIETECAFLSRDEYRPRIQLMLNKIMKDLNEKRTCTIVEGETTIYLKIVRIAEDPPEVNDFQVPILRPEFKNMSLDSWDLTTQQVLPFINGVYHVSRIAALSDVENSLVKSCVQNLVYYDVVELLPLFKYSNIYMCTRNLQNLTKHPHLGQECLAFVTLNHEFPTPNMYDVFKLYSQMTHGVNLKTLCIRLSPRLKNIDERKLVEFGIKHNLIRTINKFPIFTGSIPNTRQRLYNGLNQLDEICCKTGLSVQKVEELIDNDTNVTVICK